MSTSRRLFVAIALPAEVLDALHDAITLLREDAPELAWSPPGRRHVTMKFLGDVGAERIDGLAHMLDDVARRHRPFAIHLANLGAFPNFRRARVVWLGVGHEPRLELLQHELEVAAERLGFELEGQAFRPHVTLARVRVALDMGRLRRLARAARKVDFSASVDVAELTLFESTRAPTGAQQGRIHAATLIGA